MAQQQIPILHAYSPSVFPHPKDWVGHNFITGQWKVDDKHVTERNIGRHIPFPKLTRENLTRAIQDLQNESVRARAAELGKRIKAENGLKNALDWLVTHRSPIYTSG